MVLNKLGREETLTGYYWGLYELPEDVNREEYFCYYFSPEKGLREKVYFSNCLFEAIFSAPHGMTMSYRRTEKAYEPCYAVIPAERQRFMQRLESGLLAFTGNTIKEIKNIEEIDCVKYRDTIEKDFSTVHGVSH